MSLSKQHTENSAADNRATDNGAADNQAKSIFLAALEIEGDAERQALLDERCGDDQALRREVERLLAHESDVGSFLESPPPGVDSSADATADYSAAPALGSRIGPYKLLQQLGEGGMGVVYLAERQHPVKLRVALKLIKHGMDTRRFVARFEAERQALAMMDHPNIAKVLDAGCTESGRPYFVMELVKGVPISQFCDENRLTTRQRLELFVQVCQAVHHAHQKGIIHRDLKPSNVLVAMYDDKPVPKVIDFGVAKATNQQLTEKTLFTEIGSILGTWEYMSPEQAVLNQLDVDTRTDVYSLGALLYELLTGETPLDRQRLRKAQMMETLRMIREDEPPKPSTRLSSQGERATATAAYRRPRPESLASEVRGDLDWIVMKALAKERARRYDSASRLAEDVQHYLRNEVVEARPPSVWYQARKFYQRNKALVGGLAVLVVGLTVALTGALYGYATARAANEKLREEKALSDSRLQRLCEAAKQKALYSAFTLDKDAMEQAIKDARQAGADLLWEIRVKTVFALFSANYELADKLLEQAQELGDGSAAHYAMRSDLRLFQGRLEEFMEDAARAFGREIVTKEDRLLVAHALPFADAKKSEALANAVLDTDRAPVALLVRSRARTWLAMGTNDSAVADDAVSDAEAARRIMGNSPYAIQVSLMATVQALRIAKLYDNGAAIARYTDLGMKLVEQMTSRADGAPHLFIAAWFFEMLGDDVAALELHELSVARNASGWAKTEAASFHANRGRANEALTILESIEVESPQLDLLKSHTMSLIPDHEQKAQDLLLRVVQSDAVLPTKVEALSALILHDEYRIAQDQAKRLWEEVGSVDTNQAFPPYPEILKMFAGRLDPEEVPKYLENAPVEQGTAHYHVAVYYLGRGQLDDAEEHLEMASKGGQKISGIDLRTVFHRRIQELKEGK